MANTTISFIGAGNMARSIIGGLRESQAPVRLSAADPDEAQLRILAERFQVAVTVDSAAAVADAAVVVVAVKPQVVREAVAAVKDVLAGSQPLIVSIAAGVRERDICRWLGYPAAVVRCMPNTPALVGCGASALYANPAVTEQQRSSAAGLLDAVGQTVWVDSEAALDAVTAVSGSGPAYFFALMEAMQAAGVELGLSAGQARTLVLQTALGAARMACLGEDTPAQLREKVTSRGGTTQAALEVMTEGGFGELMRRALRAAHDRADELGEQLGAN